jgi:hypothetical protein
MRGRPRCISQAESRVGALVHLTSDCKFFYLPPKEQDWERLLACARRVRVLLVDYSLSGGLSKSALLDILQNIALYRPTLQILPRMHRLSWCPYGHAEALPYIHLFLQHSLTFLRLDCSSLSECRHQLVNVFHRIGHRCNGLKGLELEGTDDAGGGSMAEAIGTLLLSLGHLRVLCLDGDTLNSDGFGNLAGLSSLCKTRLTWPSTEESQLSAMARICERDRPFPALESLALRLDASDAEPSARRNSTLPALLGAVAGPLVEFDLHSHALTRQVFEMLGTQLITTRDTLRTLHLEFGTDTAEQTDDAAAEFRVDMDVLRPLCALPRLEHFKLSTPHLAIERAGLRELMAAWPLLESLSLSPMCVRRVPSPLVKQGPRPPFLLDDLMHIATGWRRLERLSLPMRISALALRTRVRLTHPQQRLNTLDLVNSVLPEGQAAPLSSYLSAIFPALQHVGVVYPDLIGPGITAAQRKAYEDGQTAQRAVFRNVSRITIEVAAVRTEEREFWRNAPPL